MDLIVNKEQIKRFLQLVSLTGQNQNKEALFNITKDRIQTLVKSPTNAVGTKGVLTGSFIDIGDLGLDDLVLFNSSVGMIPEEDVKIKINQNKIVLSTKKSRASLMLRNAQYIQNSIKEESFQSHVEKATGNPFVLTAEQITQLTQTFNLVKSSTVKITGKDKTITFTFEKNENELETVLDVTDVVEPFTVKVDTFLISILAEINDRINISIKQDVPVILVNYDKKPFLLTYLIAPKVK